MQKQITIPDTELSLSPLGLGLASAGLKWDGKDADYLFDAFLDLGGNVYDTARVYSDWVPGEVGRSERVLGDWLSRSGKRNQAVIITKGGHPDMLADPVDLHQSRVDRASMRHDLELSLKALRTDCIDLYFYHRDDEKIPVPELIDTMEEFVKEGKIRYYGCSNWSTNRMKEADAYCSQKGYRSFAANQALYNLGYRYMNPLDDDTMLAMDGEMQDYHRQNPRNLAMPYMGVCSGFFHQYVSKGRDAVKDSPYCTEGNLRMAESVRELMEKYHATVSQVVLGFFTCQDFACLPLYGPRNVDNLKDVMGTFEIPFVKEDFSV